MVQRGLPSPYNLKPRQTNNLMKRIPLTSPMKKLTVYFVMLVAIGLVIYFAIPDKNSEVKLSLDNDLNQQRLEKVKGLQQANADLLANKKAADPQGAKVTDVAKDATGKKMVTDLEKLKEDLKKIEEEQNRKS